MEKKYYNYLIKDKGVINNEIVDIYKIGRSDDPIRREDGLKTGNPTCELYMVLEFDTFDESDKHEEYLHKKYEKYKYFREWFILPENKVSEILNSGNWITKSEYIEKRNVYRKELSREERRKEKEKLLNDERIKRLNNRINRMQYQHKPYIDKMEEKNYGNFKNWVEFHKFLCELNNSKPKGFHFNYDILRLNGEELSKENITYLPGIINSRLNSIYDYELNASNIKEPKNKDILRYGQLEVYDTNIYKNTTIQGKYKVMFTFKGQIAINFFNDLQEAINWRNQKTCDFIKESAEDYKDVLDDKVYNILSNFNVENIRQIKNIEHYTHDIKLYEAYLRYFI